MARILLVEDVDVVREVLCHILERSGHEVVQASEGQSALARLEADPVDLIITDLWMPGMSGLSLLANAKRRYPAVPVIALSGGMPHAPQAVSLQEARRAGADETLLKPVNRNELLGTVERLLRKSS